MGSWGVSLAPYKAAMMKKQKYAQWTVKMAAGRNDQHTDRKVAALASEFTYLASPKLQCSNH